MTEQPDEQGGAVGAVPFLVEPGWTHVDIVEHTLGPTYRLLTYPNGTVRFEHRCDRGDGDVVICAPAIHLGPVDPGWTVERVGGDKPTVRPSISCPDCGTHGFVTNGRWAAS